MPGLEDIARRFSQSFEELKQVGEGVIYWA